MSQTLLKSGTAENPFGKDIMVIHKPVPTKYYCRLCSETFTREDKAEARTLYLKHQMKTHQIKHPKIHSFDPEEADEYWTQDYL